MGMANSRSKLSSLAWFQGDGASFRPRSPSRSNGCPHGARAARPEKGCERSAWIGTRVLHGGEVEEDRGRTFPWSKHLIEVGSRLLKVIDTGSPCRSADELRDEDGEGTASHDEYVIVRSSHITCREWQQVEQALRRLDRGAYETCQKCRQPIQYRRLELLLRARLCVSCQESGTAMRGGRWKRDSPCRQSTPAGHARCPGVEKEIAR